LHQVVRRVVQHLLHHGDLPSGRELIGRAVLRP